MPKCQFENNCSITKLTRSYCSTCRLERCFADGMDPLIIRSVPKESRDSKKIRTSRITEQKQVQLLMVRLTKFFFVCIL